MGIAKRKIAPRRSSAVEEYAAELEFELELERLYEERELPAAATESLRHSVTESPDDDL